MWDVTGYYPLSMYIKKFLLTHPMWDVTDARPEDLLTYEHFYSHIPCEMWHNQKKYSYKCYNFYSHIPCEMWLLCHDRNSTCWHFYSHIPCEMWPAFRKICPNLFLFLLTHPMWDVTLNDKLPLVLGINFYSHIPCEMWHQRGLTLWKLLKFLLTHPMWDVTWVLLLVVHFIWFLLTHPMWDVTKTPPSGYTKADFYSHIPCEMWLMHFFGTCEGLTISTHTSHVRCDMRSCHRSTRHFTFLLTHPMWDVTVKFLVAIRSEQTISTHTSHVRCDQ